MIPGIITSVCCPIGTHHGWNRSPRTCIAIKISVATRHGAALCTLKIRHQTISLPLSHRISERRPPKSKDHLHADQAPLMMSPSLLSQSTQGHHLRPRPSWGPFGFFYWYRAMIQNNVATILLLLPGCCSFLCWSHVADHR